MNLANKILAIGLLVFTAGRVDGQCSTIQVAINYIESSLISDLFYTEEFSKEEIRAPLIWYMNEKIPFDLNPFGNKVAKGGKTEAKKVINPRQVVSMSDANYLLFASNMYNNQLLIKLLHNRNTSFNVQGGKTDYEKWSRMNGGMSYLFTFDDLGCLLQVRKKYEFND